MSSLIQNKKAHFNYEILEKTEAGIELLGFEVKSLKKGQGSLEVKVGDKVLFGKYSGTEITVDGKEYLILKEEDILAIVK